MRCLLCKSTDAHIALNDRLGTYYRCSNCGLYFLDPGNRLPKDEEKKRYDLHENSPDNPGYRKFLSQIFEPIAERLPAGASGLDYGSGPGPTLNMMFEEAGFTMAIYDPFYHPDDAALNQPYDFITTTETAEHFYNPSEDFDRLWSLLKPGGILGVMTLLLNDSIPFDSWYYRREDTHVVFYQIQTFEWLSKKYGAILEAINDRVILMHKPE